MKIKPYLLLEWKQLLLLLLLLAAQDVDLELCVQHSQEEPRVLPSPLVATL